MPLSYQESVLPVNYVPASKRISLLSLSLSLKLYRYIVSPLKIAVQFCLVQKPDTGVFYHPGIVEPSPGL